jgi:uncharacterized membrane protein (Fun14 family)
MEIDSISSVGTVVGSGFFGGLLLGYAFKKVVKLIAVIAGLFISGLAYLQYQQLATFKWDSIEGTITSLANTTASTFNEYDIETVGLTNFGIPLTIGMPSQNKCRFGCSIVKYFFRFLDSIINFINSLSYVISYFRVSGILGLTFASGIIETRSS